MVNECAPKIIAHISEKQHLKAAYSYISQITALKDNLDNSKPIDLQCITKTTHEAK